MQTSSSPSSRLYRLLIHHPESKILDTIVFSDTMTIPQVEADTVQCSSDFHQDLIFIEI